MKFPYLYLLICLVTCLFSSCEKTLENFDLNEGEEQTVVEGLIINGKKASVKLSKTANYYNASPTPRITDAVITISDNTGAIDTLSHIGNGVYTSNNIIGMVGRTYTLRIIAEGKEYTSQSILPSPPSVDSLKYVYKEGSIFEKKGYYPTLYAREPQNEVNFYMWNFFRNDTLLNDPNDFFVTDDEYVQENVGGIEFPFTYQLGDTAKIEFYTLTKEAYDFYLQLSTQLNNDGGFYSTPPANAKGNISNGALGLFQASGLTIDSLIIQ